MFYASASVEPQLFFPYPPFRPSIAPLRPLHTSLSRRPTTGKYETVPTALYYISCDMRDVKSETRKRFFALVKINAIFVNWFWLACDRIEKLPVNDSCMLTTLHVYYVIDIILYFCALIYVYIYPFARLYFYVTRYRPTSLPFPTLTTRSTVVTVIRICFIIKLNQFNTFNYKYDCVGRTRTIRIE